jgi:hypothetical protein
LELEEVFLLVIILLLVIKLLQEAVLVERIVPRLVIQGEVEAEADTLDQAERETQEVLHHQKVMLAEVETLETKAEAEVELAEPATLPEIMVEMVELDLVIQ